MAHAAPLCYAASRCVTPLKGEILNTRQMAERLGVSPATVRRAAKAVGITLVPRVPTEFTPAQASAIAAEVGRRDVNPAPAPGAKHDAELATQVAVLTERVAGLQRENATLRESLDAARADLAWEHSHRGIFGWLNRRRLPSAE